MEAEETERGHKQIKYTFPAPRLQCKQTVACSQVKPDTQATHRQTQVYMETNPQTPCRHVQACIAWLVRKVGGGRGVCHWPQDHTYIKPRKVALTQKYFYDTLHTCLPCVPAYSMLAHCPHIFTVSRVIAGSYQMPTSPSWWLNMYWPIRPSNPFIA